MSVLTLTDVCLEFGEQVIFRNANFVLELGERVCLIGRNGAGKSTLFRLIKGDVVPDEGEIRQRADIQISQLEQALPSELDITVREFVAAGLQAHQQQIDHFERLTKNGVADEDLAEVELLQRKIETHGGWDLNTQINTIITSLELPAERRLRELSGGWQRRVSLGRALVNRPDVLLLDEPTNHLDLTAIQWLENRVRSFEGSIIFITHDRAFLRALATRIVDIDRGELRSWPGDYNRYLRLKDQTLADEKRHNTLFDKKLAEEEAWIRQGIKARRTRNEGRVRALEQMRVESAARIKPESGARIVVQSGERSSRRVVQMRNVSYGYGDHLIINSLSLKIMRGERIGLIGNNGVGKSTLLRLLLGQLEAQSGTIKLGENLEVAYFDQLRRELDPQKSVAEIVGDGRDYILINGKERHVVGYLRGFLFSAKRAMTPVGFLSGGECNRVILAKLFTRASNFLILDEPTNDLDVETLEVLEEQLAEYEGTLIVVSHDRAFLDNVVSSTLVFESGGVIQQYPGGYSDWLRQGRALAGADKGGDKPVAGTSNSVEPSASEAAARPKKLTYMLQRELDQLPDEIEQLEAELTRLQAESAEPAFYDQPFETIQPILDKIESHQTLIDTKIARWDELESLAKAAS